MLLSNLSQLQPNEESFCWVEQCDETLNQEISCQAYNE
jgi:hypothetical protein